jgi:hypothetical protein
VEAGINLSLARALESNNLGLKSWFSPCKLCVTLVGDHLLLLGIDFFTNEELLGELNEEKYG